MVPPLLGVGLLAAVANPPRAPTLVLRVQYDGTGFSGWADTEPEVEPRAARARSADAAARSSRQTRAKRRHGLGGGRRAPRSVQGTLARALWRVHGAEGAALEVRGASRTDAGVHARGQVCHVVWRRGELPYGGDLARFAHALNRMLPPGELAVAHEQHEVHREDVGRVEEQPEERHAHNLLVLIRRAIHLPQRSTHPSTPPEVAGASHAGMRGHARGPPRSCRTPATASGERRWPCRGDCHRVVGAQVAGAVDLVAVECLE